MSKAFLIKICVVITSMLLLTGCANTSGRNMNMAIQSVHYLNPNESSLPEPVTLTVFELKLPNKFKQANYNDLIFNSMKTLGADLIDKENIIVRPSESNTYPINLSNDVKYVGFVASFRSIDQSSWKKVIQIPAVKSKKFDIVDPNQSIPVSIRLQSNEMIINQPGKARHLL